MSGYSNNIYFKGELDLTNKARLDKFITDYFDEVQGTKKQNKWVVKSNGHSYCTIYLQKLKDYEKEELELNIDEDISSIMIESPDSSEYGRKFVDTFLGKLLENFCWPC